MLVHLTVGAVHHCHRKAARLARAGCPYRTAWQIAWRIRYQVLNDRLDDMVDREIRDPLWGQQAAAGVTRPAPAPAPASAAPRPAQSGAAHVGPSRLVRLSESRSLQPLGADRRYAHARASNALAEYRPSIWSTRVRRLRRILLGIARLLGFEPPRMSREHRKMLRLEYQHARHTPEQRLIGRDPRSTRNR